MLIPIGQPTVKYRYNIIVAGGYVSAQLGLTTEYGISIGENRG